MSTNVLLVTGSRALADTPGARAWAHGVLDEALISVDLLVAGGAAGPDTWARELAERVRPLVAWREYRLDGGVHTPRGLVARWDAAVLPSDRDELASPTRRPLRRNRAMVEAVARAAAAGHRVRVVAVRAPWARTAGTAYTARLAREAGLRVVECVCPVQFGPAAKAVHR